MRPRRANGPPALPCTDYEHAAQVRCRTHHSTYTPPSPPLHDKRGRDDDDAIMTTTRATVTTMTRLHLLHPHHHPHYHDYSQAPPPPLPTLPPMPQGSYPKV